MAQKKDEAYRLNLPRLGNAVIINNVSSLQPETDAEVEALRDAFKTVGFHVFVHRDCGVKELDGIQTWMTSRESHQHCNAFSLVMICDGTEDGQLSDCQGETFSSINELTDKIVDIQTLNKKPKLILIKRCNADARNSKLPELPCHPDTFIAYCQIKGNSIADGKHSIPEYLQAFAEYLKEEYMYKSVKEIFGWADKLVRQKLTLTDAVLTELAQHVAATDMEVIALEYLGIKAPTIKNLNEVNREKREHFNFEILRLWREKSAENSIEKLAEIVYKSGKVDPHMVKTILESKFTKEEAGLKTQNSLQKELRFEYFHMKKRKKIFHLEEKVTQLEDEHVGNRIKDLEKERENLSVAIAHMEQLKNENELLDVEKKMLKQSLEVNKEDNKIKIQLLETEHECERKKVMKLIENEERQKRVHQKIQNIRRKLIETIENLKPKMTRKSPDKKLEETQNVLSDVENLIKALITQYETENQQLKEELKEARKEMETECEKLKLKIQNEVELRNDLQDRYDKQIEILEDQIHDDSEKIQNLTEEKVLITQCETKNQQLQEKLKETREEMKTQSEKFKLKIQNEVELRNDLQERYEKQIKILEDQIHDDCEKIQNLTEEKALITQYETENKQLKEELKEAREEMKSECEKLKLKDENASTLQGMLTVKEKGMNAVRDMEKEKVRELEDHLNIAHEQTWETTLKHVELDLISSHEVKPTDICDMTVMRKTGLIVVSSWRGSLHQFSLEQGRLIEKQIKSPCEHDCLCLLCIQVTRREYLALSCAACKNIKLMKLNKQKGDSSNPFSSTSQIKYKVITAFSGKRLFHMCLGEENRMFVQSYRQAVLELDTSTTTFAYLKTINNGWGYSLCYVPDPHQLLAVSDADEVRADSCDVSKTSWSVKFGDGFSGGYLLYTPILESIFIADRYGNRVVSFSLNDRSRLQSIKLPDYVRNIKGLCVYDHQIIVCSEGRISYFSNE